MLVSVVQVLRLGLASFLLVLVFVSCVHSYYSHLPSKDL